MGARSDCMYSMSIGEPAFNYLELMHLNSLFVCRVDAIYRARALE